MPRRLPIIATFIGTAAAVLLAFRPLRWEVEGVSMAPGLVSGDVVESGWFPPVERLCPRRRFDRWIVRAPDGSTTIKRLVGLPGERLAIERGDLSVSGTRLLTPPTVLAEVASPVAVRLERKSEGAIRFELEGPVLDDAAFAPEERRLLLPVRDVGIAALVQMDGTAAGRMTLVVEDRAARFTPQAPGRFALVAGRLDGRFVATAWPLARGRDGIDASSPRLPDGAPAGWRISSPWADDEARDEEPPRLECRIETGPSKAAIRIVALWVWRDVLHRPAADGAMAWRLGPHEVFVLGDFPSGSRDSRHWGPIGTERLLHRVEKAAHDAAP